MARVPSVAQPRQEAASATTVQKQNIANRTCRNCGSAEIRPSNRRNAVDILLGCLFLVPFRCRTCRRRFYLLWRPGMQETLNPSPGPVLVMPARRAIEELDKILPRRVEQNSAGASPPREDQAPQQAYGVTSAAAEDPGFSEGAPEASGPANILLLERDLSIRKLLRRLLERRGNSVVEIEQGDDLANVLRRHRADLLVAGLSYEGQHDANSLTALASGHPGLRILALATAGFEFAPEQKELDRRMVVLQKPFSLEDFIDAVERLRQLK